jgi:hypothetical protein
MVERVNGSKIQKLVPKPEPEWSLLTKDAASAARQMGLNTISLLASIGLGAEQCQAALNDLQAELRGYEHGVREGARIRGVMRPQHNPEVNKLQQQARALRALASKAVAACLAAPIKTKTQPITAPVESRR